MQLSPLIRIGVLRGGPSDEYEVSLKSGAEILRHLSERHNPVDIFIDKNGTWHMRGLPAAPEKVLQHVDVVWNALHGSYGEDGTVQHLLETHRMPFTGSGRVPSAVAMNKKMTKDAARKVGLKTPIEDIVRRGEPIHDRARTIYGTIPRPHLIKPLSSGSSMGVSVAKTIAELTAAIEKVLTSYEAALVEEYIFGREASCAVLDHFRNQRIYSFPPIEIVPPQGQLFDYDAKYGGESREICPGRFSEIEKRQIEEMSRKIHETLRLSHYSRSDFIVSPRRGVYFLEVNTLPGTTSESLLPKSCEAVGLSMPDFIYHVLDLALNPN